jgi:16S rRNA (uracil1498-N3)-methyltransferase
MTVPLAHAEGRVRLFVGADLDEGSSLALTEAQAHYLANVMRLGAGDPVRVFNGRDGEWLGRIARMQRAAAAVRVEQRLRAQDAETGPWLVFAPVKKSATDYIIEKATELGAGRLLPVMTERTVAARVPLARMQATAIEAAEQCGRLTVPEIAAPCTIPQLVADWPRHRLLLLAHAPDRGRAQPVVDAISAVAVSVPVSNQPAAGLLVGPEGGLTASEVDVLASLPCAKVVHLGPRTLRAETAVAALLTCWQCLAGDWREGGTSPGR